MRIILEIVDLHLQLEVYVVLMEGGVDLEVQMEAMGDLVVGMETIGKMEDFIEGHLLAEKMVLMRLHQHLLLINQAKAREEQQDILENLMVRSTLQEDADIWYQMGGILHQRLEMVLVLHSMEVMEELLVSVL